jgi:uncharacterized protein YceK
MDIKSLAVTAAVTVALSGCATIVPNYVAPEFEHMSHAAQHWPITNQPTRYGANMANLVLHWDAGRSDRSHLAVELAEGIDLDKRYPNVPSCGEIMGPREEFTARIRYQFQLK